MAPLPQSWSIKICMTRFFTKWNATESVKLLQWLVTIFIYKCHPPLDTLNMNMFKWNFLDTVIHEIWRYWFGNWKIVYFPKYACIIHQLIAIFVLLQDKFKFKYISPEERLEEENKANKKKVDKRSYCYTNNQGN
jgi:hypothetical protein